MRSSRNRGSVDARRDTTVSKTTKMPKMPKNDVALALRAWNALDGLPRAREAAGLEPLLRIEGADVVRVRFRRTLDAGVARAMATELEARASPPAVVVAERSTGTARRILEEHGIGVVDVAGHARLRLPGLVVRMEAGGASRSRPTRVADGRARGVRLRGRTGLVGQALLLWPGTHWQGQALADRCGLSPSPVHFVLRRLEESGMVTTEGRGPRKTRYVAHREALLDLLVEEHLDRGVAREAGRLAGLPVAETAGALAAAGLPYAVTGAAAFDRRAAVRAPAGTTTIWVGATASLTGALAAAGAQPADEAADVELRQVDGDAPLAFARSSGGVRVANPVRVYLDLVTGPDGGGPRAAQLRRALVGRGGGRP